MVAAALDKHGLRGPKADPKTPVILQTFGQASARKLAQIKIGVPVVLLLGDDEGFKTAEQVTAWKGIVQGFGPAKSIVLHNPDFVKWAHAEGFVGDALHVPRGRRREVRYKDVTEGCRSISTSSTSTRSSPTIPTSFRGNRGLLSRVESCQEADPKA